MNKIKECLKKYWQLGLFFMIVTGLSYEIFNNIATVFFFTALQRQIPEIMTGTFLELPDFIFPLYMSFTVGYYVALLTMFGLGLKNKIIEKYFNKFVMIGGLIGVLTPTIIWFTIQHSITLFNLGI